MLHTIDAIIWRADADSLRFEFVGGSVEEILGYSAEEWLSVPGFWQSKLHPEDSGRVIEACSEASRLRRPHRLTYRMVAADGRAVWLQDNVKITVEGDRATLSGIMIDVTELVDQRQQLATLNSQNAHYRTLYNLVPVAIWEEDWTEVLAALRALRRQGVSDINAHARRDPGFVDEMLARLRVIAVNRAAVEMFRASSAEDLIRRASEVFLADQPFSVFLTALDAILRGQRELEGVNTLRRLDGETAHVMYRIALPRLEERSARIVICEMDVSAAHAANERFELVTRATTDVIWDFDIVNDRLWASDGLKRTFGLEPEAMAAGIGNWTVRIHPEDRDRVMRNYWTILHRNRDEWGQEYRFMKGDGSFAVVRHEGFILRNDRGAALRMVGSVVDITEQHRLEQRLIQSQKFEAMGKLTGGIAHDFNNLLTIVLGSLEALEDRLGKDPTGLRHVEAAMRAVDRSTQLISQLLSYARQQPLRPRSIDMARQVAEMVPMIQRALGEHVEMGVEGAGNLWRCRADPGQFENALLNLCINARDAMPGGGALTIGMRNETVGPGAPVIGEGLRPGRFAVLSVADTGHGMDAATARAAFDPFFTTKEVGAGSGLGLSMVQGFAQQSQGLACIQTENGKGTVVEIYLPALGVADAPDTAARGDVRAPGPRARRILLVEDQEMVRNHMTRLLEGLGYSVAQACSAADALEALSGEGGIDLVLTDIVLPGGVSGLVLAETARDLRPGIPVLYTSGFSENGDARVATLQAGQNLLRKPFRRDELAGFVRAALGEP